MKTFQHPLLMWVWLLLPFSGYSQMTQLTNGEYNYRSVVNNGRILISKLENNPNAGINAPDPKHVTEEEMNAFMSQAMRQLQQAHQQMEDPTQMLPLTLLQYDMRTRKQFLLTEEALHWSLVGPPDMDLNGSAVWVENRNNQAQVIFWNGVQAKSLTSNQFIGGSPSLGKATMDASVAYPRIHMNDVVFRDKAGHVYLYEDDLNRVRKLTNLSSQTANTIGDNFHVPAGARLKNFEFNGDHIVWMHKQAGSNNNATMTIFRASFPNFEPEAIARFDTWSPGDKAVAIGGIPEPFFVACGGEVAFMYLPPSTLDMSNEQFAPGVPLQKAYHQDMSSWNIRFTYGSGVQNVASNVPANFKLLRLFNGQVVWAEHATDDIPKHSVKSWQGGRISTIHSHSAPPKVAVENSMADDLIYSLDFNDGTIVWAAQVVKCEKKMAELFGDILPEGMTGMQDMMDACSWVSTGHARIRSTAFAGFPTQVGGEPMYVGGSGQFDRGLFVYELATTKGVLSNDVAVFTLYNNGFDTETSIGLYDSMLESNKLNWDEDVKTDPHVVDQFLLEPGVPVCGSHTGTGVRVKSISVQVDTLSGILADYADIEALMLYHDVDLDGEITAFDELLGTKNNVGPELQFDLPGFTIDYGDKALFVLKMQLKNQACPCNQYLTFIDGKTDVEIETENGLAISIKGETRGRLILPKPEFTEFGPEFYQGDGQAWFEEQILPEALGIRVREFPIRCGEAQFTLLPPNRINKAKLIKDGQEGTSLIFPFVQEQKDAIATVQMKLGDRSGLYNAKATIKGAAPDNCEQPSFIFREFAGKMTVELIDLNNLSWLNATVQSGGDPSGRSKTEVSLNMDPGALATGGQEVTAASADGTSAILIRAKLVNWQGGVPPGPVRFTIAGNNIGHLTSSFEVPLPYQGDQLQCEMQWQETPAGIYAFAVYTPPLNYSDASYDRSLGLTVTYQPPEGETMEIEDEIRLYRPPILLVHGMWSSPSTWGPRFTDEQPRYETFLMDYASSAGQSFYPQGNKMKARLREVCQIRRDKGIATTKVAIVAHSMGGLMTRSYIAENDGLTYSRIDNFGAGDVYKFITVGTPHWGSPIAWLTINLRDHPDSDIANAFNALAQQLGADIHSGSVDGMCPNSEDMNRIGQTHVPTHTIAAWQYDSGGDVYNIGLGQMIYDFLETVVVTGGVGAGAAVTELFQEFGIGVAILFADVAASQLYSGDQTDFLVTKVSQIGGIAQYSTFDKTIHAGHPSLWQLEPELYYETNHPEIANKVWELMEADVDDIGKFARFLPAPEVQPPGAVDCLINGTYIQILENTVLNDE
ncbi:MAG: hypothetical protein AAF598_00215 [Bacteroidota bacterium]